MTGYGQASAECAGLRVTAELRSVNNRHADVRLRVPAELAAQESELRREILRRIRRGRVELSLVLERTAELPLRIALNRPLVEAVAAATEELRERFGVNGRLDLATLLAVPGMLESKSGPGPWGEEQQAAVRSALDNALQALDRERQREGENLRRDLLQRVGSMERLADTVSERARQLPSLLRQKLLDRLEVLAAGVELDPARVAQEAAFLADRSDVTEEVVRLRGHLAQVRSLLAQPDGEPVGRRLDFLLQEIHRETNTINGKSVDLELSEGALQLKVEADKVREQIQNLE